ncbi:MAG: hypothetical protein FWF83_05045 [Clostridiales bacterium]|nr:hypothetical protein [Clostridiales bacterium]
MFSSQNPPLLTQPIDQAYASIFSEQEGYHHHFLTDGTMLVSYKQGWIFPFSPQQRKYITAAPLLLVKNSGHITSTASTTTKGFAHIFCDENGSEPSYRFKEVIFPVENTVEWMLVPESVTMIWFQYADKSQYLGESGSDILKTYYGKLLIRAFIIREELAPGFDRYADLASESSRILRVENKQLYNNGWNVDDEYPEGYFDKLMVENGLEQYAPVVRTALKISAGAVAGEYYL